MENSAISLNPLLTELTPLHYILEESNFNFGYVKLWDLDIPREKWMNYLKRGDPDQMPHSAAFDLGLNYFKGLQTTMD